MLDITNTKIAENELLTLFQAMTDVILVIDKNGRYIKFAPTNTSLLYLPPAELKGKTLHEIFPVEDAEKFLGYVRAALKTGTTQNFEYSLPINGKEIWFNGTTAPMNDDTVILVSRDVTAHKQAENVLRRNEAELKDLFDYAPIGYHELNDEGRVVRVNQSELEMLGYTEDEMLGHFIWEFVMEEVSREAVLDKLHRKRPLVPHQRHFRKKGGGTVLVLVNDRLIEDENGLVTGIRTTMQNITDIKRAEEALVASEEKYRLMGDSIMHQIWTAKPNGEMAYANQRVAEYFGLSPEEFILNYPNLVHPDDWEAAIEKWFRSISTGEDYIAEYRLRRHDGEYFWFHGVATAGRNIDGEIIGWFGTNTNIDDRKQAESKLTYLVGHDTLTDLSNRTEFMNHLDRTIQRTDFDSNLRFAVLFLDVDRFKLINDSLGHHTGDKLLIEIARRLKLCLRPTDTIARLGGDEFTILLTSISHSSDAVNVAKRFLSLISEPFIINAYEIFTSASIGIVVSDDVNRQAEDFLRDADTAMYRAKSSGKNRFEIFDREMHIRNLNLLQVENDLRRAIERNEFRVFYQPIIELKTGKITKFEALIRWQHPERGLVFPDQFIEIAEETGLIIPIGQIILEEACRQTVEWKKMFPEQENLCISVNLSAKELMHPNLIKQVTEVLEKTKIAARDLNLEITESMVMEHKDKALSAMSELNELGVTLSTDDFGTGYSSLSYLHQFPFDCLKIDRSFVNKMELDEKSEAIVRTILLLAQNLNIEVVAEGIENETQLNLLRKNGCENGQGYLFSKPVPAETAQNLLENGLPQIEYFSTENFDEMTQQNMSVN